MALGLNMSFEVVAGGLSIAFAAFRSCVYGFDVLRKARAIGQEGDLARVKLEVELFRLVQWGETSGLCPNFKPNERLNWDIIVEILRQEESLLTSAQKLRTQYHLDVEQDESDMGQISALKHSQPPSGLAKVMAKLRPDLHTQASKVIQYSNGPIASIKWGSLGEKRINKVIDDLTKLNNSLFQFLETEQQNNVETILSLLGRDLISGATNTSEVNSLKQLLEPNVFPDKTALIAAASLKQIRLLLGLDKRPDEEKTKLSSSQRNAGTVCILKKKRLRRSTNETPTGIELASYASNSVIAEWKASQSDYGDGIIEQIQQLAVFLGSTESQTLHTPPCRGFLKDDKHGLFALIYNIPDANSKQTELWSLRRLLSSSSRPSLTRRIAISLVLAETILQLHTAGWLHKGLRSDNVVFITSSSEGVDDVVAESPFVLGYENARPDCPDALTQTATTSLVDELYRHPEARGKSHARFCKRFDMYALGCVFLEILSWKELVDIPISPDFIDLRQRIAKANSDGEDILLPSIAHNLDKIRKEIEFYAGDMPTAAVLHCFDPVASDLDHDTSLEVEHAVVRRLKTC